ncbi:hypothetical protein cypCar_00046107 [Cyprinus carpio]|nr:hypothetical protein cypCar_00046107 [Cyprinus carpio]
MVLESISKMIKTQLPTYLKKLPIPDTISGFARLTDVQSGFYEVTGTLFFPVCDKSHIKHNELTGDNVGPLILKKKTL